MSEQNRDVIKTQQAEFLALFKEWEAPVIESLRHRKFSRKIAYTSPESQTAAGIEVQFVKNYRLMEWGALWAATVTVSADGGVLSGVPAAVLQQLSPQRESAPDLLISSTYDPLQLPPLRRDGTLTFTADTDVSANFQIVAEYTRLVSFPLLNHFVHGEDLVIEDILSRDGFGYRYPAATIVAACVALDDPERLSSVAATARFRKLPDARAQSRKVLLEWASTMI
jgi:hypothetical protein